MKKKIVALCLVVAMAAVAVIGATMAYFTDTDHANNTFTVGGVNIELVEQQRNKEGTELENFAQNKVLMPLVGSAQTQNKDEFGMPSREDAKNYVDKIITVKNTGKSDAYVRVFIAIPEVLDDIKDAGQNILHFNYTKTSLAEGEWSASVNVINGVEIGNDGIKYNIYCRTYQTPVAANKSTETPAWIGFYLDKNVDINEKGEYTITRDGNTTLINYDFKKGVTIPVFAQAIQAAGFSTADEAFAASGLPTNPWTE